MNYQIVYNDGYVNQIDINNYKNKDSKNILIIKDSFSSTVIPFLEQDILRYRQLMLEKVIKQT